MSTSNPFSLDGETALITGGGTGLGLGIATCLAKAGARVVLVGRRPSVLEKAAGKIGQTATFEPHDITHFDQADAFIHRVAKRVGPISILVNNAGIHLKKSASTTTTEEFNAVMQTHVVAAFSLVRAVLPDMVKHKHGNILFTASMASLFGIPLVVAHLRRRNPHTSAWCARSPRKFPVMASASMPLRRVGLNPT